MLRPADIISLMDKSSETIGTHPMAELGREMAPILVELITTRVEDNEHPTGKKLFNWLVAADRTGEEVFYVTGPLQQYVSKVMIEHFKQYIDPMGYKGIPAKYMAKVAAEAMAVNCPILKGPWEHAAWVLVIEVSSYSTEDYGFYSEKLTTWIINVISNPIVCPNPYLRIEFMILILAKIEFDNHKSLQFDAMDSVLFACSSLNIEYLQQSAPQYGTYHQMDIHNIMGTLNSITVDIEEEFADKLAEKLQKVRSLRLSAHVHDAAYHHALNVNKFEEPQSLHGVLAILKTINGYVQINYKDYLDKNPNLFTSNISITSTTHLMNEFICIFRKSCFSPFLIGQIATCILTIIEIVMSEYCTNGGVHSCLSTTELFLGNLFLGDDKNIESCEYKTTMDEYKERLTYLKTNYC